MKKLEDGKYSTTYKQIHSTSVRGILKYISLFGLTEFYKLTNQFSQLLSKDRIQFLYMHHIFRDEERPFRKFLRTLMRDHSFISYSEAANRVLKGNIDRPYVAVSFDDGFGNCLSAASILNEFDIKACFFICGSMIGETDYGKIKEFCHSRLYLPPVEFLSWSDVEKLLRDGHEIGSHTMNHTNLAGLPVEQARREITESFNLLTRNVGDIKHFSWPLGRFFHITPDVAKIVFETGFKTCASAERGCHVTPLDNQDTRSLCIRRDLMVVSAPVNHNLYFMARNSKIASAYTNQWPAGWSEIIQGQN